MDEQSLHDAILMPDSVAMHPEHCSGDSCPPNAQESPHSSPMTQSSAYTQTFTLSTDKNSDLEMANSYSTDEPSVTMTMQPKNPDSQQEELSGVMVIMSSGNQSAGGLAEFGTPGQEATVIQPLGPLHPIYIYEPASSPASPMLPSPSDTNMNLYKTSQDDINITNSQVSYSSPHSCREVTSEISKFSSSPLNTGLLDIASSPPSSSPPQIFSSSPFASSQASEPSDDFDRDKQELDLTCNQIRIWHETACDMDFMSSPPYDYNHQDNDDPSPDTSLFPPSPSCLPVSCSPTDGPPLMEEDVSNNDSGALCPLSSTPDPGTRAQSSLDLGRTVSVDDCHLESYSSSSMMSLSVQPLQCVAEHPKSEVIFVNNDSQEKAPVESSLPISSPHMTPRSSPLPQSSSPGELSSSPMYIDTAEVHQDHVSVPAVKCTKHESPEKTVPQQSPAMGKRKRGCDEIGVNSTSVQANNAGVIPVGISASPARKITDSSAEEKAELLGKPDPPNPKRSTIASQKQQHQKLITPFRSPLLKRTRQDLDNPVSPPERGHSLVRETAIRSVVAQGKTPALATIESETFDRKKRHRTRRAAAQFKSPLCADASSKIVSSVRLTPTIQAQERKLQILKRAVKVNRDGDEETLEALVKKWTEAGREVAWEVWDLVKDNGNSDDGVSKTKPGEGSFENGWGWNEKTGHGCMSSEIERNWGWDVVPNRAGDSDTVDRVCPAECEDEEPRRQDTLGTMLMQLGIAPETLGWNEEEENFATA